MLCVGATNMETTQIVEAIDRLTKAVDSGLFSIFIVLLLMLIFKRMHN